MHGLCPSIAAVLLFAALCSRLNSQTTQGMITGHVRDQLTGAPIANAVIEFENLETNTIGTQYSSADGNYYIALLPPGSYRIRVNSPGGAASASTKYQAREIYGVQLDVAGYVRLDFQLRPLSDVWERNRYRSYVFRNNSVLPFFGPDVDPSYVGDFEPERRVGGQLEPSMSDVIDPTAIALLPLAGRDVYTALVLLPGVTADTATTRSLGLSANGQRPSASNFLLDGVEENDALLSGPAIQLVPEMVQEYRVSTNNFSAEYGRTSGYVANAVTRSASRAWHGIAYGDWNNDVLNANTFDHNTNGLGRTSLHQIESGLSAGGAIPHSRLLTWTAYDYFGSRSFSDPTTYTLPTQAWAASLPGSLARQLLGNHPPRQWADPSFGTEGPVSFNVPVTLRRSTALERLDYMFSSKQRIMARVTGDTLNRPDFNWSPYGQAPLSQQSLGAAVGVSSSWSPDLVSDIRASFLSNYRTWDLILPNLPRIGGGIGSLMLPGFCCELNSIAGGWKDRNRTTELSGHFVYSNGAHVLKFGTGLLIAQTQTGLQIPPEYRLSFSNLQNFAMDKPYQFVSTLSRTALAAGMNQVPDMQRRYRDNQPYTFVQEDWRVSPRFTVNAGIRFDRFPSPTNTGSVPDTVIAPGPGNSFADQISSARVITHRGELFAASPNNWSVRLAFSLGIFQRRGTVLRGGFGTFYDRPFDNFYVTASANDLSLRALPIGSCPVTNIYAVGQPLNPLPACSSRPAGQTLFDLTMFQPGLRSPRIQSFFLSLQQPLGRNLSLELNGTGSRGRQLLSTDIVNRQTGFFPPANSLPDIDYRTNQGFSDYAALSVSVRYRSGPITLNSAYTWSHSIDNQSDPLLGEYFDFGFSNQTDRSGQNYLGAFTFPGDTRIDRGNSDFDQRHNLVGWATVAVPYSNKRGWQALLRNWNASAVFALRSGLPYSVFAGTTNCFPVCNTRADIIAPNATNEHLQVPGGVSLLNAAAFSVPADGQEGNSGRNAFIGPGFANLDFSLSRTFTLPRLGEQRRLTLRADAFNVFNHPNLQNPEAYLGFSNSFPNNDFGVALYGRPPVKNGFPALTPLAENARQVHLLLRFEF